MVGLIICRATNLIEFYIPDVAAISYPISELAKSQIPCGGACGFCGGPPAVVGGAIEHKQNI